MPSILAALSFVFFSSDLICASMPSSTPFLAELPGLFAQVGAVDELKTKLQAVLDIVMLFGFLYGTIRIIGGAGQMRRGETEEGKSSIISGALIAAAPLIMRILFEVFFKSGGSIFGS